MKLRNLLIWALSTIVVCYFWACTNAKTPPNNKGISSSIAINQTVESTVALPLGIMSFGWGKNFLDTKSLDLPYISGMTAYFGWKDIEQENGVYNFSDIDKLISLAKRKNKIINIGFYPGSHAPEWLYQKGVKSFSWERNLKEDQARLRGQVQRQTSPLPWDSIFLDHWKQFISKVAEKYKNEQTVGYISLTGPVIRDLSTNIPLKNDADWERFVSSGYEPNKLRNAWIEVITHYQNVLPNKRLVLAIGPLRPGSSDVRMSEEIVNHIIQNKYSNISFLCVFLNDTWFLSGGGAKNIRDLLEEAKVNGLAFGYQMAQSAYRNSRWANNSLIVKSLRDSLSVGITDSASWIEVWHDDIIDPKHKEQGTPNREYVSDLEWANQELLTQR